MIDTIKPQDTDAVHFWNGYVSQRKPVLLDGHLMDADWKATAKWDDAYLFKHAGDARVMVEQRDGLGGSYGQGRRVPMAFKDLLQRMREGDNTLYLTTQQVGVSKRDGHPELWAEPLCRLTQDFTPSPSLMGGLVPQQVNLWMGCAKDGASSGLHHDFHDNLYVLMRGQKRFRLWPPSHAPRMHTAGKVAKVHPNGRIVYEGQGDIRADGSSASEVALWEDYRSAEAEVQAAEQKVAEKRKGAAQALEAAEARLEAVLDEQLRHKLRARVGAVLDAQQTHQLGASKGGGSKKKAEEGSGEEEEEGEESSEEDEGSMDLLEGLQDDYMDEDVADSSQEEGEEGGNTESDAHSGEGLQEEEGDPPSFCTGIDLSLPDQQLQAAFPGFPGKAAATEVTLTAGQMLFLPAGWFHEVTSFSPTSPPASSIKGKGNKDTADGAPEVCGHMAVNLWFHPPDNLKARGSGGVARPYKSDYWPALWRSRAAALGLPVPSVHEAGAKSGMEAVCDDLVPISMSKGSSSSSSSGRLPPPQSGFREGPGNEQAPSVQRAAPSPCCPPRHPQEEAIRTLPPTEKLNYLLTYYRARLQEAQALVSHSQQVQDSERQQLNNAGGPAVQPPPSKQHQEGTLQEDSQQQQQQQQEGPNKRQRKGQPKKLQPLAKTSEHQHQQLEQLEHKYQQLEQLGHQYQQLEQQERDTAKKKSEVEQLEHQYQQVKQQEHQYQKLEQQERDIADGPLLPGEDGDLGDMVAEELHSYFQSPEGSGAFSSALGTYMLKGMLKVQLKAMQKRNMQQRRCLRTKGRRHHRCVRSQDLEGADK